MRISELRMLDIVNIKDGRRLGPIKDLDLDLERGCVKGIVLSGAPRSTGWSFFGGTRTEDVLVSWDRVKKIGVDVILIDVQDLPEFNAEQDYR